MDTVGDNEAKIHLDELLDRVARGEKITITRHGVPVAVLLPADVSKKIPASEVIDRIKKFRKHQQLEGLSIREMIEEGRR